MDCIHLKVRDRQVANRPIFIALAATVDGNRDILELWGGAGGKGAKYWLAGPDRNQEPRGRGRAHARLRRPQGSARFRGQRVADHDRANMRDPPGGGEFPLPPHGRTGTRSLRPRPWTRPQRGLQEERWGGPDPKKTSVSVSTAEMTGTMIPPVTGSRTKDFVLPRNTEAHRHLNLGEMALQQVARVPGPDQHPRRGLDPGYLKAPVGSVR